MTYQEANALVDDFSFVYKGKSISKEVLIECREVIHKALEKQIPKKPTSYKVEFVEKKAGCEIRTEYGRSYSCPRCERFLSDRYDWCYACGQALDWSEYND